MKWFAAGIFSIWAAMASAQDADIQAVIASPLDAVPARDAAAAFDHASEGIRGMFGSSDNFAIMVQRGYPMVWNPDEFRFLDLRDIDGKVWQKGLVRDQEGTLHILDYQMIPTENGWKINAVQVLPAPDVAA